MSQHLEPEREYVCGFMFELDDLGVLLIRKKRPTWQAGKMNGIGGRIEDGETPEEAMRREFREEAALDHADWRRFCTLRDERGWLVHFFSAAGEIIKARSQTDESLVCCAVDAIETENVIPNLRWLIPMAINMKHEQISFFEIQERAAEDNEQRYQKEKEV